MVIGAFESAPAFGLSLDLSFLGFLASLLLRELLPLAMMSLSVSRARDTQNRALWVTICEIQQFERKGHGLASGPQSKRQMHEACR